eukprot:scaffold5479_cov199-Amphora_coffeaeformis.AAC.26
MPKPPLVSAFILIIVRHGFKNHTEANNNTSTTMQRLDVAAMAKVSREAVTFQVEPGPYFLGNQFSAVDIALAPFWQRILWVGGHYRDLSLPNDDAAFGRLEQWWQAVSQRPSVAHTLVGRQRLIASYKQYAQNVATSDWATTMQSSMSKHDDDDDDDD